ncbi:SixA phosphatase family protein [Roseisalinus antarcticus]|nr:histidine phosphatase family protein [Roseisalinus antarcticus]
MRHAKSDWDDPFAEDHARVLNRRGRVAAATIGRWLARNGHVPDLVLCSDAARTVETWERVSAELPGAASETPEVSRIAALYHAGPDVMLAALRRAGTAGSVAMVGHNPGIAAFAMGLVAGPPPHPEFFRYPTGAVLVADFPVAQWRDLTPRTGQVVDFVVPRDLET